MTSVDEPRLFEYSKSFPETVESAVAAVTAAVEERRLPTDLDAVEGGVFLKNAERMLVIYNSRYRELFLGGQDAPGRSPTVFLGPTIGRLSQITDDALLCGAERLDVRIVGEGGDGRSYVWDCHKRLLRGPEHPLYILGVIRPIASRVAGGEAGGLDYDELFRRVRAFDRVDLTICRRVCDGATNQALSDELGVTTRAIEMRRQKILTQLGLSHTVELVKLLVRLQDRGYLDLGI